MDNNEAREILIEHNQWRRGEKDDFQWVNGETAKLIGQAIDCAIQALGDGWVSVESITDEGYYLCVFKTVTDDIRQCVVSMQYVPRHCFENPPMDKTFFVYPSAGHRIIPIALMPLPPKPKQP